MNALRDSLTVMAELNVAPGNIAVSSEGRIFLSLHQFHDPAFCVCELVEGQLVPYPNGAGSELIGFTSVLGVQIDLAGCLWMLDNGDRNRVQPKLVAWNIAKDRLERVIYLPTPISTSESFVNDLAIDLSRQMIYISDPIQETSAVIRVDLATGLATRLLEGHKGVVPEDMDLIADGVAVQIRQADGTMIRPHLGVNGIVLDVRNEWVYLSPMHAGAMYRVLSRDLADLTLDPEALAARVERYADKPICDGITIDQDDNIYLGDLAAGGVGVIRADRTYELLVRDERLGWTDSFSFGPDGMLYCDTNQLNRSAILNGGQEASLPPYYVLRMKGLAAGIAGR
jgi:sugar lactone lactonase YvrE